MALDGSEERSIQCLRADGQIPFGYLRLSESRLYSLFEDLRIDTEADPEEDNGWDTDDSEEIVVLSANVSEDEATLDEDDSDGEMYIMRLNANCSLARESSWEFE